MEDQRSETEKATDDVMLLPGFRFHPTDEELVGFYLKRKVHQRPLSIELIKQLDIYKYDPWDLPKLASTGEKEWYFYCPRDRKYRNSARPNRVTGSGFWKATGTDRPIYSSEGNKCIGLKKSLVFYKGRAAKGLKTDWMMHEFRLPSLTDPTKRSSDKSFSANDSWAICRIFKKTNSTAQRALSHSWVSPLLPEPNTCHFHDHMSVKGTNTSDQFSSDTISNNNMKNSSPNSSSFSPVDFFPYKPYQNPSSTLSSVDFFCPSLLFPPLESSTSNYGPAKSPLLDNVTPSMLPPILGDGNLFGHFNKTSSHCHEAMNLISHQEQYCGTVPYNNDHDHNHNHNVFQGSSNHFDNFITNKKNNLGSCETISDDQSSDQDQWEAVRSALGFPFNPSLPLPNLPLSTAVADPWKPSLIWETSQSPSQVSRNFPTTRCFT